VLLRQPARYDIGLKLAVEVCGADGHGAPLLIDLESNFGIREAMERVMTVGADMYANEMVRHR